jgi:RHS repeat-associated protein
LQYDAAGQMTSMQRANGLASNYDYDADGRIAHMTTGSLASISLTRDAAGRVVSADRNLPLAPALPDSADTFSYDAASQLTTATYDASGHVTAQGTRSYTWDGASRLTSFTDTSSSSSSLTYDSLGEIASVTTGSTTSSFVFNYALKLPALSVVRQNGADLRYYVYLPNGKLLYSMEGADNTRHFYHFDEAGNTAFLTDDGGNVTDTYAITPYGEVLNHPGTSDNPFTYQGQYGVIQEAPGLYYMRSRHYDAATARFLSRDTVSVTDPRGVTPYVYARANPMLFNDPLGNGWGFGDFLSAIGNGIQAAGQAVVRQRPQRLPHRHLGRWLQHRRRWGPRRVR